MSIEQKFSLLNQTLKTVNSVSGLAIICILVLASWWHFQEQSTYVMQALIECYKSK